MGEHEILRRRRKENAKTVWDENGDDPRDIPGPKIYGEEIDSIMPPVYIVSDFHIGSSKYHKRNSNDMDQETLKNFIIWLKNVDKDAFGYSHYDVIMNGDFFDLWQAFRPRKDQDTYENRLSDILESNKEFISHLGKFLGNNHRCHFYYLVGNHDDALSSGPHDKGEDLRFGKNSSTAKLRKMVSGKVPKNPKSMIASGIGRVWSESFFKIQESYSNKNYSLWVEHGHKYDSVNLRDDDGEPADGQKLAEFTNQLQQTWPAYFKDIEYAPPVETVKYLQCLNKHSGTPPSIKKEIENFKNLAVSTKTLGSLADFFLPNSFVHKQIKSTVANKKIKDDNRGHSKKILEDIKRTPKVKIVVFGHSHLHDLDPGSGESKTAYANTGAWLRNIKSVVDSQRRCKLQTSPSDLPYTKISKVKGENKALVELKFFRERLKHLAVKVWLN